MKTNFDFGKDFMQAFADDERLAVKEMPNPNFFCAYVYNKFDGNMNYGVRFDDDGVTTWGNFIDETTSGENPKISDELVVKIVEQFKSTMDTGCYIRYFSNDRKVLSVPYNKYQTPNLPELFEQNKMCSQLEENNAFRKANFSEITKVTRQTFFGEETTLFVR